MSSKPNASVFWFQVSGGIGTALFYLCYEIFFRVLPFESNRATICWTASYLLSILWQHSLHRFLVYGRSGKYWSSLFWTYVAYSLSLILSSVANHILVSSLGVNHRIAFVLTLVTTGVLNYFTVSAAFNTGNADPAKSDATKSTD